MPSIEAFRIALGRAESGVSEETLNSRKTKARQTAFAYMPSLQGRFAPHIKERLVAESGTLWLAFDLAPTMQMRLALDGNPKASLLDIETSCQLREEYAQLRNEAGEFVVRCGRLLTLASVLPHLDAAGRCEAMESLSHEDRTTWESIHRLSGCELSIKFGDETLSAQLPTLNLFLPEPTNRIISAKVSGIRTGKQGKYYELTSIRDISTDVNQVVLPASMSMDRPRRLPQPMRQTRFLLHVAEEFGIRLELEVRVNLYQSNLTPALLEFRGVNDRTSLQKHLQYLLDERSSPGEQTTI
jgi:hypothetical protein